jgi:predicted TIM-barrel fold metal-dependent hydrolase
MIVDFHTHVGDLRTPQDGQRAPVTFDGLLRRLDEEGIDRAVVLPLGASPESTRGPWLFVEQPDVVSQIRAGRPYRDRLVMFGNLDPRMGCAGNLDAETIRNPPRPDFSWELQRFTELGCRGIGEMTANVPFDDPRLTRLCQQCGAAGLPVVFHVTGPGPGVYGVWDEPGAPRMQRLLEAAPDTVIVGHGPGFWAEISAPLTVQDKFIYPVGKVEHEGSLPRLLRSFPNLYADISANSGFNALTRDPDYGPRFLEEFQDRIVFGTDVCYEGPENRRPHLGMLRDLVQKNRISKPAFEKIAGGNAERLLGLTPRAGERAEGGGKKR